MKIEYWLDVEEVNKIEWINKYNQFCKKLINHSADDISSIYSYFSINDHKNFIQEICNKINLDLSGTGLEIGSGPGIFSNSILKIFNDVDKIYLLEMIPEIFILMEKVSKHNKTDSRLSGILGDFNDLKIKDNSLDFVLDFDSIHHSENFDLTFKEISRVLKPGGVLLCFDRGHPNYISDKQVSDMLDIEYSKEYKIENNMDPNKKFTRRMNGEHEPLLKDWINTSKKYGFINKVYFFNKKNIRNFFISAYGLFVPYWFKKLINKGINITTHYQIFLSYFGFKEFKYMSVYNLKYKAKNKKSPNGKMVFLFKKI